MSSQNSSKWNHDEIDMESKDSGDGTANESAAPSFSNNDPLPDIPTLSENLAATK